MSCGITFSCIALFLISIQVHANSLETALKWFSLQSTHFLQQSTLIEPTGLLLPQTFNDGAAVKMNLQNELLSPAFISEKRRTDALSFDSPVDAFLHPTTKEEAKEPEGASKDPDPKTKKSLSFSSPATSFTITQPTHSADHGGDGGPPPHDKDDDKEPRGAYFVEDSTKSENEIKITLVSTSPLIFKIEMSKRRLSEFRLTLNTPWINLVPKNDGSPVQLSLFFGKPVAPSTDYRVFPLIRTHQPIKNIRVNSNLIIPNEKIPKTADSAPELAILMITEQLISWFENEVINTVGITHTLDSVPQTYEAVTVTLSNAPVQAGATSYSHHFTFTEENAEFHAHAPLTHHDQILDHMMKEHSGVESIEDVEPAMEAYLADSQPVEGCADCASYFPAIDAYRQWRRQWNQATHSDTGLVFYMQIHFQPRDK